jgi:NAD(P)-dependent dehydrogenase (short-subunit alcohol dehydrogenase family)
MSDGRVVLITGTSTGFGRLAVPLYLERGWTVIATMRDAAGRGKKIFSSSDPRLHILELDVERPEDWAAAARYIEDRLGGRLDVLVNNAGYGLMGALEDQTLEQLRKQFEVNFFGLAGLTRTLLPLLRRNRGRILNVSSIVGLVSTPFFSAYNATKHAVEGFTESLYYELKPLGVQVGLIEPGAFRTDFATRSLTVADGAKDPRSPYAFVNEPFIKMIGKQTASADPMIVARKMVKLSECSRVPLRTLAGTDAHLMATLRRILPHGVRVGLMAFGLEQILKRIRKRLASPATADQRTV